MPSLKTRLAYQNIALSQAGDALADAATAVSEATTQLEELQAGELDLTAIKINGTRFIKDGDALVPE